MKILDVCAAVIRRDGQFLLASRPAGRHLAGKWEFPGGKVHEGETLEACICREIQEELHLTVSDPVLLTTVEHQYPEKQIRLHFLSCAVRDDASHVCLEGQQADWFSLAELQHLDLAPADRAFLGWLSQHQERMVES